MLRRKELCFAGRESPLKIIWSRSEMMLLVSFDREFVSCDVGETLLNVWLLINKQ